MYQKSQFQQLLPQLPIFLFEEKSSRNHDLEGSFRKPKAGQVESSLRLSHSFLSHARLGLLRSLLSRDRSGFLRKSLNTERAFLATVSHAKKPFENQRRVRLSPRFASLRLSRSLVTLVWGCLAVCCHTKVAFYTWKNLKTELLVMPQMAFCRNRSALDCD